MGISYLAAGIQDTSGTAAYTSSMRRADLALDDNASTPYLPTLPTSYLHACACAPADEPCTGAGVVSSYICSKCIRRNVADSSLCVCLCACVCDEGAEMRCCQVGYPIRAVEWRVARSMSLLPISASTSLPVTQLILPASSFSLTALHTLSPPTWNAPTSSSLCIKITNNKYQPQRFLTDPHIQPIQRASSLSISA